MKNYIALLFLLFFGLPAFAQMQAPPEWNFAFSKEKVEKGEEVELIFTADIPDDWYLYSSDFDPDLGPMLTEFSFEENGTYELVGGIEPVSPKKKYDDIWGGEYTYFTGTGQFRQKVRILETNPQIKGVVSYQICSDVTGQCIPFDTDFAFNPQALKVVAGAKATKQPEEIIRPPKQGEKQVEVPVIEEAATEQERGEQDVKTETAEEEVVAPLEKELPAPESAEAEIPVKELEPFEAPFAEEGEASEESNLSALLGFFLISFGAGLTALLTPCVFPMIPMTVTYFTKTSSNRTKGITQASIYGISIVVIYTLIGTVFSLLFGAEFANWLSTHWVPNLFFFAVFVLFALSFFGLFEISLPSGLVNNIDRQADRGGLIGIFFMAFTLVLVGFSCTGPIVGSILIGAATGEALKPVIGMLGFSIAFAIPFTLFAIFPGWLSSLPKSGGWLNSIKVVLGFLELALALKFLSVADQVYHWGILDREVYIALWIVIFTLLGFYLLGKLRLPHDSPQNSTSVPRLIMAILVFGFVVYLIPGLIGAPLKALAGYLPPMSSHDFNLVAVVQGEEKEALPASCEEPKYADMLHLPHGISGYFDYEQALACAREQNKPLFIDFTGHGCVNCREMEANVWSDPEVLRRLKEDYVVVALYVDEKTELPVEDWYISAYDKKVKKSIGKQNLDFMIQRLNANAQPYYTLIGPNEELLAQPKAYDLDVQNFVEFLDTGLRRFKERQL
ncbi:protein-disulfide reductase DsbD family protein [Nafulsella turpanensis]|uniref:protein-disulfide reductase DsbD family protein n=1 Tax=Nafulsella turpanensis TaxID=1265690 RepID=UPI000348734F|nr:cytochrome c biogenesis protein CcdA [Nafulsella turpanensis]